MERDDDEPVPRWERIEALFARSGGESYGDRVTQLEHAVQSAHLASCAGASSHEILAALLHDVGHLVADGPQMGGLGTERHEEVGAALLVDCGFGTEISDLVALHVAAKRYLVAVDPAYRDALSPASLLSLDLQGGPMSVEEADAFAAGPHAPAACRLRRWDDAGKEPGLPVPSLESYRDLLESLLR